MVDLGWVDRHTSAAVYVQERPLTFEVDLFWFNFDQLFKKKIRKFLESLATFA